jgi:hypothetical protein
MPVPDPDSIKKEVLFYFLSMKEPMMATIPPIMANPPMM